MESNDAKKVQLLWLGRKIVFEFENKRITLFGERFLHEKLNNFIFHYMHKKMSQGKEIEL